MIENSCCSVQFNFCGTGSKYVRKFQVSVAFIYHAEYSVQYECWETRYIVKWNLKSITKITVLKMNWWT